MNLANKMLYGYEKLYIVKNASGNYEARGQYTLPSVTDLSSYPLFASDKDGIPTGRDFGEATITTSIKDDIDDNGTLDNLYNAYFAADLDVRVSKPAIVTL